MGHFIAAILSFFVPGLGQLVKGDILKAIIFFLLASGGLVSIAGGIGVILYPLVVLLCVIDAFSN